MCGKIVRLSQTKNMKIQQVNNVDYWTKSIMIISGNYNLGLIALAIISISYANNVLTVIE